MVLPLISYGVSYHHMDFSGTLSITNETLTRLVYEVGTSAALATRPHLVSMDKVQKKVPRFSSRYLDFSSGHRVEWYARTERMSKSGVLGDPTRAGEEKDRRIVEIMLQHLVRFVEDLKSMTLEEIHGKGY